jgi:O-antigen ligase
MRIVVLYGLTFVLSDRGITAILLAMFLAELVVVTVWLPIFSLRLFKIQGVERLNFFNNLITALLVGAYFYLFINEYYIASVVTIAVALALLFRQYKLISEGLRQNIWDRLRYFSKFIGI